MTASIYSFQPLDLIQNTMIFILAEDLGISMRLFLLSGLTIFGLAASAWGQSTTGSYPPGYQAPPSEDQMQQSMPPPATSPAAGPQQRLPAIIVIDATLSSMAGVMQVCHPPVAVDIHNCMLTIVKNWSSLSSDPPLNDKQASDLTNLWKTRFLDAYQKQMSPNPPDSCADFTAAMEKSVIWNVCYGTPPDPDTGSFGTTAPDSPGQPPGGGVKIQ